MSTSVQNREKLDNVRELKFIYMIHPDDREHSEILKNARRKLERLVAPNAVSKVGKLQFGAQVHSDATSHEDSECKSCADKEWKKLKTMPAWEL